MKWLCEVFTIMRGWGDHIELSLFECRLTRASWSHSRPRWEEIIDHQDDRSVVFFDLGPAAASRGDRVITALGNPYVVVDPLCVIV